MIGPVGAERSLGLFVEPAVNRWAEASGWIADAASWMYVNSHFTVTTPAALGAATAALSAAAAQALLARARPHAWAWQPAHA